MQTIDPANLSDVTGGAARAPKLPENTAAWVIAHTPGSEGMRRVGGNLAAWVIKHTKVPKGFKIE